MSEGAIIWCFFLTLFLAYTIMATLWFNRRQDRRWDAHLERHMNEIKIDEIDVEEIGADRADS